MASLSSPRLATVVKPACSVLAAKLAPLIAQSAEVLVTRLHTIVRAVLMAQVDVTVDETRQHEQLAEIDDRSAVANVARTDLGDATVAHDDGLLRRDATRGWIGE